MKPIYILNLFILFFLFACGPTEEETKITEEEKKAKVEALYSKILKIPASYPCNNLNRYKELKSLEDELSTSYYSDITKEKITSYENACDKFRLAATEEAKKRAELNKVGDWQFGHYVDEFGDNTDEGFIKLETLGTFSNSATEGSSLRVVMFLSDGSIKKPWFRFYEYNSRNPIKGVYSGISDNSISCRVKDNNNNIFSINLYQYQGSDTVRFNSYPKRFRQLIVKEGLVKFSCIVDRTPSTKYKFTLNFKYFKNTLRIFNEN